MRILSSLILYTIVSLSIASLSLSLSFSPPLSQHCPMFSYNLNSFNSPANWYTLCASFSSCAGKMQSPINLKEAQHRIFALDTSYITPVTNVTLQNVGYSIKSSPFSFNSSISVSDTLDSSGTYDLQEFHFQMPSEHSVGGKFYDLEVRFVHTLTSNSTNIAVIAYFIQIGNRTCFLSFKIISFGSISTPLSHELFFFFSKRQLFLFIGYRKLKWFTLREEYDDREKLEPSSSSFWKVLPLYCRSLESLSRIS